MKRAIHYPLLFLAFLVLCPDTLHAGNPVQDPITPEDVVEKLYTLVTFPPGPGPDWDEVRSLFHGNAVVVLRTGRDRNTVFTLEGFIADFVEFIKGREVIRTGFSESVIRKESFVFGDIAQVWVLYEAWIPGSGSVPQPGVDAFSLVRYGGRWQIVSIVNELPGPGRPLPPFLSD